MTTRWQDWAQLILGVWLFFSPWILGYTEFGNAAGNAYIIGIAITVLGLAELYRARPWEEWTNLILGVWLVISPWVLGFTDINRATQNAVVVGIIMIILPLWAVGTQRAGVRH